MSIRRASALSLVAMGAAGVSAFTASNAGVKNGCFWNVDGLGSFNTQWSVAEFTTSTLSSVQDELSASSYTVEAGNSPLARRFDITNIGISSDNALTLTVPGGQSTGPISSAQITTAVGFLSSHHHLHDIDQYHSTVTSSSAVSGQWQWSAARQERPTDLPFTQTITKKSTLPSSVPTHRSFISQTNKSTARHLFRRTLFQLLPMQQVLTTNTVLTGLPMLRDSISTALWFTPLLKMFPASKASGYGRL